MLSVSALALPHLMIAAKQEQQRLMALHQAVGDDWPPGFDPNDIWLFDIIIQDLAAALQNNSPEIDLTGKPLAFLLAIIPNYLAENRDRLASDESQSLETIALPVAEKILCPHCRRTATNGNKCKGICVADSDY
jgi:hypothetical protein